MFIDMRRLNQAIAFNRFRSRLGQTLQASQDLHPGWSYDNFSTTRCDKLLPQQLHLLKAGIMIWSECQNQTISTILIGTRNDFHRLCFTTIFCILNQLVSGSFMDYAMPRAENFPVFQVDVTKTVCPSNPLGIKGCGEAGAIAAPAAVMNAITNAIGTEHIDMPATPAAVWRAIQQSAPARAGTASC